MRTCRKAIAALCTIIAVGMAACDHPSTQPAASMTTEEIIRQNAHVPIGQAITPTVLALAKQSILVAIDDTPITQPTKLPLLRLGFKTSQDNRGGTWVYAYTNQAELSRVFPQGGRFAELSFKDFFAAIERDLRFAGIFINSGSDASCPIPRELFGKVRKALSQSVDR